MASIEPRELSLDYVIKRLLELQERERETNFHLTADEEAARMNWENSQNSARPPAPPPPPSPPPPPTPPPPPPPPPSRLSGTKHGRGLAGSGPIKSVTKAQEARQEAAAMEAMTRGHGAGWMKDPAAKPIYAALRESQSAHAHELTGGALTAWKRDTIAALKTSQKGGSLIKLADKFLEGAKSGLQKFKQTTDDAREWRKHKKALEEAKSAEGGFLGLGDPKTDGFLGSMLREKYFGGAMSLNGEAGSAPVPGPPGTAWTGESRVGVATALPFGAPQTPSERRGADLAARNPSDYDAALKANPKALNGLGQPRTLPSYRISRGSYVEGGYGMTGIRADTNPLAASNSFYGETAAPRPQRTVIFNIGGAEGAIEPQGVPPMESDW